MEIVVGLLCGVVLLEMVLILGLSHRLAKGHTATASALGEMLKAMMQLNLKIEAAKHQADETFFKKTDVA